MGAMTSPAIYNKLRAKKASRLASELADMPANSPVLVSCPSCKMGLTRILINSDGPDKKRRVLHNLEFLVEQMAGKRWRRKCAKLLRGAKNQDGVRFVDMSRVDSVQPGDSELLSEDDHWEI